MHLILENGRLTSPICMKKRDNQTRKHAIYIYSPLEGGQSVFTLSRAPLETKRELPNAGSTPTALAVLVLPFSVVALMTQITHLRGCILKRNIITLLVW